MDFYFADKQHGNRFVEFLQCHVPTKCKYSRKLVSADHSANTANFKHNHLVEVAPICRVCSCLFAVAMDVTCLINLQDDLVFLPKDLAHNLSNISRFVLVKSVAAGIHVIDPFTCEVCIFICLFDSMDDFSSSLLLAVIIIEARNQR